MAILSWDEAKGMVGYDNLSQDQKVAEADKYSQYVQKYYSEVDPQDPKIVGESVGKFIDNEAQNVLGDLDAYQRTKQFFGQIGKGAGEAASLSMRGIAVAQQVIGETMNQYDDNSPVAERDLYKMGEDIDARVKETTGVEDPRLRGSLINTMLPNAFGNALGFLGASTVAAGVATGAVAAAGASIPAVVGAGIVTGATALAAGGLGSAMEAGSLYQEAKQYGADEGTARLAAAAGVPIGATEAIPFAGLGKRLLLGTAEKMGVDVLSGSMKAWSKGLGKETIGSIAAKTALEEGGQEGFQQFLENATAKTLYDPSRGLMDNVATSALVGAIVGAGLGGGVQAITRDNEYFYAQGLGNELAQQADLAASLTPERITQINQAAQNAFTTTEQKIDLESGETSTTESKKGVFGDRKAGDVPDIGNNPAINSYPLGSRTSQDENGINTETMTFHTPQGLLWEAEFKSGEPVKVRDVTDTSPLLGGITNPSDPKTATRSQFTGRIISPTSSLASEFGLETEQEMDRRLISEAQQDAFLGRSPNQTRTPDNQVITNPIARDDRGVARQDILKEEIDRLYRIREAVLAKQILVGENPAEGTPDQRSNTAKSVTTYDSNGKPVDQKTETSKRVGKLNRMIGQREVELRGLTARPEGYILASDRQSPPSESQKASLAQGFQKVWESITSPEMRNAISFEVGDITPLIESGQVPKGAVAYYQRAIKGRKAMVFLSDRLATLPLARREMLHELGHAFYDTLPLGVQVQIRNLWKGETESRTGALFDEYGALLQEVSPRVMDSVQEFFSERMAWTNDHWAKGMTEQNKLMDQVGRAFRSMVDKFMRYTGHGERLNLEFRAFLDQGDRFTGLRRRINQIAQTAAMSTNAGDINRDASVRGLTGSSNIEIKRDRVATTGAYVGLPKSINTEAKLEDLRTRLEALAFEGEAGRFWYEVSSQKILDITGGSIKDAETLVAFIAVYSPQNKVYPNWGQALRAYAEYKRGVKIQQGKTGRDIENGQKVADGERWQGIKTHNFYHNLMLKIDPSQTVSAATVDMWIMRVLGYPTDSSSKVQYKRAEDILKEVAAKMGWEPQQVQAAIWVAGKAKWEEIIWPEIKAQAKSRGEFIQTIKEDGTKKWEFKSKEIAAKYRKVAMLRVFEKMEIDMTDAASNFSNMANRNLVNVGIETRFGTTTGITWQDNLSEVQLLQYHKQKEQIITDADGSNIVFREFGVPVDSMYNAVGLWKSQTNPLSNYDIPSYRETIGVRFKTPSDATASQMASLTKTFGDGYIEKEDNGYRVKKSDAKMDSVKFKKYAEKEIGRIFGKDASIVEYYTDKNIKANVEDAISAIGILFKQDGMAWHQMFDKESIGNSNGIRFNIGRQTSVAETSALSSKLGELARSLNLNDYDFSIINDRVGFRVLKFTDKLDNVEFHGLAQGLVNEVLGDIDIEVDRFGFDGNLITNDWSKNTNGEVYRQRISESGRSDVLGRIENLLLPQIERLDTHWRGIAESSGRAGSQPAGGQSTGTGQVAQGRSLQKTGSPEVVASTRGEQTPESQKERADLALSDLKKLGWKTEGAYNIRKYKEGVVNAQLRSWPDGILFSYISTPEKNRGIGLASRALKEITQVADKNGVVISSVVDPTMGGKSTQSNVLNKDSLFDWYARNGFERDKYAEPDSKGRYGLSDYITRQPAGAIQASTRGDQAQRLLEPVFSFGRQQLRTGGALPNDIFRITEQRGFSVNEKLLRAQNAVNDLESAVKRVMGKSFDKLSADEVKKINDAMQNPALRASLPTDIAAAVGNARNLIDSLTQDLLRSGAISEDLKPILEANKGVYLHRSYEKWENPNYKNPFNTLPKQVQNRLVSIVTSFLHNKYANAYAKEQSLLRGEPAIDRESGVYQADFQAGLTKARSGGVTKAEVNGQIEYLASPETDSPFGQIGSGLTKDLSIITARKDIPEEIRMLWGEIKDPRVNFLKSVQKMAGFLETHNMLKNMKDAGMNKIFFTTPRTGFTTKLVSDGSRTSSPLNMFVEGMSNEVYTSEEIATALRNTFGTRARPQDFIGKMGELYLKANGFTKFAKTVLSVQTQVRNVLGNASFLVANGYVFSPDGFTALNKLRTLALPSAGTQLGLNKSKEFRDYNAKLTRLGILGQSVFANEMESYFKDANMGTAADFFDNHVTKVLKTIGRGATNAYQLGDAIPKIVAFEVELSRLRRAYPTLPLSKLEPMAADKVLNLLPTYSRIPRLGNVLRSQPFVGAFISFPLEVLRTGYNLLGTINEELRSDNPAIRQSGAYRLVGTLIASVGFSAAASAVASAMGIDDDEDKDIRKLDAPWDKYATKLYLGRDAKGNIQQVNLSYVDPYNYLRDPILALVKADGSWDQKLMEAVKTGFEPLFGEQMLAGKILDISRNKKGTTGGRVYNPEGDIASKAMSVSAHMFDAFNIGTIVSADRVYKGLTGQVSQTGRAYDPALEAIATVTGQRVVTLDMAQSLGFAARRFSSRLNDATGIFTAAYYDKSNVDESTRLNAYKEMVSARNSIFSDTGGLVSAVMRLGLSRGEVMMVLKEQGISAENARALTTGTVSAYRPAKLGQRMDAIRFRQQTTAR